MNKTKISKFAPLASAKGGAQKPIKTVLIREELERFRNGYYRDLIERVRMAESKEERKKAKLALPALTFGGVFDNGPKGADPNPFSGRVQVDIDNVDDISAVRKMLESDKHMHAVMLSPSASGVKALMRVPLAANAGAVKKAVIAYISSEYGLKVDPGPCGRNSLFFVTYDPDIYINEDCIELDVTQYHGAQDSRRSLKPGISGEFSTKNKLPLAEIKKALSFIPMRPSYDEWIKIANAVRAAAGTDAAEEILVEWSPEEEPGEYRAKMCELPMVTAAYLFGLAYQHGWRPCVYFENQTSRYWLMNASSNFRGYTKGDARGFMEAYGLDDLQIKDIIHNAAFRDVLDYVLNISGMSKGLHEVNGKKVLVPIGPRLITPAAGNWDTIKAIVEGMFGSEQAEHFFWWLSFSLKSLYSEEWQPSQVLAFVGPPATCKSLLQRIITDVFGGRQVRAIQFISGGTSFNGDWAEAGHLVIEDDFSENNKTTRGRIKEEIKSITVNPSHRVHPKGKEAIEIPSFVRMTMSCNPVEESLAVIPHLDESVMNKISLLETRKFEMPMPAQTAGEKRRLWAQVEEEAPALIHDLLHYGEPPTHLRDPEGRFGIKAYHSSAVLKMIEEISPEFELLNAISDAMSAGAFDIGFEFKGGNAPDSRLEIIVSASEVHEVLRHRGAPHYWNSKWIGRKLSTLASMRPERVQVVNKSNSQGNRYRIVGNGHELL